MRVVRVGPSSAVSSTKGGVPRAEIPAIRHSFVTAPRDKPERETTPRRYCDGVENMTVMYELFVSWARWAFPREELFQPCYSGIYFTGEALEATGACLVDVNTFLVAPSVKQSWWHQQRWQPRTPPLLFSTNHICRRCAIGATCFHSSETVVCVSGVLNSGTSSRGVFLLSSLGEHQSETGSHTWQDHGRSPGNTSVLSA